jgi:replicative DNA helicase
MKEQALPAALAVERLVLGSVCLDGTRFPDVAGALNADDFTTETHQLIFRRMADLHERRETIDRVTLAQELLKHGELEACGGLTYLVSLDEGLPQLPGVESYTRIVRDKATLRKICYAAQALVGRACDPTAEPAELLAVASGQFLSLSDRNTRSTLLSPQDIIEKAGGIGTYLDRRECESGVASGFGGLDKLTGGFRPGSLYILAARPAMGKTALAMNIAERVVLAGGVVPVFSLEMDAKSLLDRMVCSLGHVNTRRFDGGWMDKDERAAVQEALARLVESHVMIDDKALTNLHEIHSKIRQQQVKGPVSLVVLDYLQLLIGGRAENRVAETSLISRSLKLIAKDCKVPILALSQLSRACDQREDHRPMLADLRESGSIEQDADVVGFLFREEVYRKNRDDLRGVAELNIAKHRGGPEGLIKLVWRKEFVRFEEMATNEHE